MRPLNHRGSRRVLGSLLLWAVCLCSLVSLGHPGTAEAQYGPYLPPQPNQHAIIGRVAGLGAVEDADGQRNLVEYDENGVEVRRWPLEDGIHTEPVSVWNGGVNAWLAAAVEYEAQLGAGSALKLTVGDYQSASRQCLDGEGDPSVVPTVPEGTQWVLVANPSFGLPICAELVLAVSSVSPDESPDVLIENSPTLLLDASNRIVAQAATGGFIALEAGYFRAQPGQCVENPAIESSVLRNLTAYSFCSAANMERIWAPIVGAAMSTTDNLSILEVGSSANGAYRLDFTSYSATDDWSGDFVFGEVNLDAFNQECRVRDASF